MRLTPATNAHTCSACGRTSWASIVIENGDSFSVCDNCFREIMQQGTKAIRRLVKAMGEVEKLKAIR